MPAAWARVSRRGSGEAATAPCALATFTGARVRCCRHGVGRRPGVRRGGARAEPGPGSASGRTRIARPPAAASPAWRGAGGAALPPHARRAPTFAGRASGCSCTRGAGWRRRRAPWKPPPPRREPRERPGAHRHHGRARRAARARRAPRAPRAPSLARDRAPGRQSPGRPRPRRGRPGAPRQPREGAELASARRVARLPFALFAGERYVERRAGRAPRRSWAGHDVVVFAGELAALPEAKWL